MSPTPTRRSRVADTNPESNVVAPILARGWRAVGAQFKFANLKIAKIAQNYLFSFGARPRGWALAPIFWRAWHVDVACANGFGALFRRAVGAQL